MNKINWIKVIGFGATFLGFAAEFVNKYVDEKQMDEMITEKVNAALAQNNKNEES